MGGMTFNPETLGDSLSETAGYKSGLALSIEEMCDHLAGTGYTDLLLTSETKFVRIRSEEYDDLFYKLLHRIGYTEKEYDGDIVGVGLYHKYKDTELAHVHEGVLEIFSDLLPRIIQETIDNKSKLLDPTILVETAFKKYGKVGMDMVMERLEVINRGFGIV